MVFPIRDKPLSRRGTGRSIRHPTAWAVGYGAVLSRFLVGLTLFLHGCERREIVRPTPQMDIESRFWVRVLMLADASECTIEIPSAFQIVPAGREPGLPAGRPAAEPLRAATRVQVANGRLMLGATPLVGGDVVISPERPHVFRLNGQGYRGKLKLTVDHAGQTFEAVNLVPLEPYLAGVVGAEMPDYWEPQALQAQAIAARTYCLYIKHRFGVNRRYDVSRTQASQVYSGISAESTQVWNAVNSTYGKVLVVGGSKSPSRVGGNLLDRGLFPTYYSSVCGGHTADSETVFGDSFAPLKGVPCPYCQDVARLGLFFWPMAQFDRETVTRQLANRYPQLAALGGIREIVAEKRDYGKLSRLTRITLVGKTGRKDTLRGEDLRLALDPTGRKIKSTACHIVPWGNGWAFLSGRGWGHGVGMCQCGAEGMARQGRRAEAILQYYYPGCEIVSVY
jgi:stage II sporulation protein D